MFESEKRRSATAKTSFPGYLGGFSEDDQARLRDALLRAWERGEYSLTPKAKEALALWGRRDVGLSAPILRLPAPLPPLVLDTSVSQLPHYETECGEASVWCH